MGVIEFKLNEVMGRHRIKQRQLAEAARIRPAAVNALYHGTRERVDMGQLAAVLDALNALTGKAYTVADLLEYTPADGDAEETAAVLADHPDILERVRRLEAGESKLIPWHDLKAELNL
ncbi:helix-turn-helix domain-containing protein [Deinococcus frigens]|uniref:helix-turn-helix domain-containing protein n=1 Tax=Deinococcus frigens TaxID=249403 RepID=UPI000552D47C|nr:helix-turn-helix transcriptional regulator [Deinococcus frigens]